MSSTRRPLDFFFFIGSTYTYLSVMRIEAAAAAAGVELRWRPFFLREILLEQDNSPFIGKPAKMRYMWRDLERRATRHGVEFAGVPPYPVDPGGLANRLACLACREDWGPGFVRETYRSWFLEHTVPGEETETRRALARLGKAPEPTIARANSQENRDRLAAETQVARELGLFGSPTFAVGPEIFWGDDRLEEAIAWTG
jgi:2-hydroxychromene-2-carboxylate isomerase